MQRSRIQEIASQIPCADADRAMLVDHLDGIPDEHGMRAMVLQSLETILEETSDEVHRDWLAFKKNLPRHAPFSYLPFSACMLAFSYGASVIHPTLSLIEGCKAMARAGVDIYSQNPLFRILWNSVDEDLMSYLQVSTASNPTMNFSYAEFEVLSQRSVVIHNYESYSILIEWLQLPYFEGLLENLGHTGTVELEIHDDRDSAITISWE